MVTAVDHSLSESGPGTRAERIGDWVLIVAFCTAVSVPGILSLRNVGQEMIDSVEQRRLSNSPDWSQNRLSDLPAEIDAYVNDRIGFRRTFIGLYNFYLWQNGTSPNPAVVIGRDNWLYHNGYDDMDDFCGKKHLTPGMRDRWKSDLEARQKWLAERGIKYLFFIAPNKQTIHPEFLPLSFQYCHSQQTTYDQLLETLRGTQVNLLDLREPLLKAAKHDIQYYQQDTHWNDFGRRIAYQQVIDRCRSMFPTAELGPNLDFVEIAEDKPVGDLRHMMGIPGEGPGCRKMVPREFEIEMVSVPPGKYSWPDWHHQAYASPRRPLRLVIFGDSFLADHRLDSWIASHFGRTISLRKMPGFKDLATLKKLVDDERPDLVIDEQVERFIYLGLGN
jgi:hypothetical protein